MGARERLITALKADLACMAENGNSRPDPNTAHGIALASFTVEGSSLDWDALKRALFHEIMARFKAQKPLTGAYDAYLDVYSKENT